MKEPKHTFFIVAIFLAAFIIIVIPQLFSTTGCSKANTPSVNEESVSVPPPSLTRLNENSNTFIYYVDNNTKIVYIVYNGAYSNGLSPYYMLDDQGVPHLVKLENNELVMLPNSMAP